MFERSGMAGSLILRRPRRPKSTAADCSSTRGLRNDLPSAQAGQRTPRGHYQHDSGPGLTIASCISLTRVTLCDATQWLYAGDKPSLALVWLD
jgi:hypothetical protein